MFIAIAELLEQYVGHEDKLAAPYGRNQYSSDRL